MGGGEAGLSGFSPASGGVASLTGDVGPRRGETGICDRVGLTGDGAGPGTAGRLADDDEDTGVCVLRPKRASSSLHTAKLRLPPSAPPNSEFLALS